MRFYSGDGGHYLRDMLATFPWTAPQNDHAGFVVVDVGGGVGSVSVKLAECTEKMRFVVQDKESTVQEGRKALAQGLRDRVAFMTHDFFQEQKVRGDVYLFRWILHNWSDVYCIRILRALIPALNPGARILVHEHVMEEGVEVSLSKKGERYVREEE